MDINSQMQEVKTNILNYSPEMEYRRFGKTNKMLSTITLGGMRYKHVWGDPRDVIPQDSLDQCAEMVDLSFKAGINHIETAYGYKKSEHMYGQVLNDVLKIPRESYYLMTKGPAETAAEMRQMVEKQLKALKTDYFDFYGWHGINSAERFFVACRKQGPVEELLKMKEEGIIRHVGFSTHAPYDVIIKALETDYFEFINLHYYYFFQKNQGAVLLAQDKDMGVFIISPNDKGGQLFYAPDKLKNLTSPLTPIQWNARFCLRTPAVHTLSFGMSKPEHIKEMKGIFPTSIPFSKQDQQILNNIEAELSNDPYAAYDGYELKDDPTQINIPEMLRMRRMWKCYDMLGFAQYRYNEMRPGDLWNPGRHATSDALDKVDYSKVPKNIPLRKLLTECHEAFFVKK